MLEHKKGEFWETRSLGAWAPSLQGSGFSETSQIRAKLQKCLLQVSLQQNKRNSKVENDSN